LRGLCSTQILLQLTTKRTAPGRDLLRSSGYTPNIIVDWLGFNGTLSTIRLVYGVLKRRRTVVRASRINGARHGRSIDSAATGGGRGTNRHRLGCWPLSRITSCDVPISFGAANGHPKIRSAHSSATLFFAFNVNLSSPSAIIPILVVGQLMRRIASQLTPQILPGFKRLLTHFLKVNLA